ncbi:hypothetical protein VE04_09948, partial [Pseudogymnoascus sp. 24MN13]
MVAYAKTTEAAEIMKAVERATRDFNLCPNRVWAIARSLPRREKNLPLLIPPTEKNKSMVGHEDHKQCTFDFCEYSRLDFTSVVQRHEYESCTKNPCERLQGLFPSAILEKAAIDGGPTAWVLDGGSMVQPLQRYMAISHVWSDGTGTGAWADGEVNKCLYTFFKGVAQQFQCEGIWWDTICIPRGKVARSMAINKIQDNYEDARITLVHDCFLRNWEWVDAETACFAIIMSPWFSRGWTSLELAKSPKVKVMFKGHLIKDLDEDILAKANGSSERHRIASKAIINLRNKIITNVNDLLTVLGPRHTSWPRDIAIISGLLVGVEIGLGSTQQDIYQRILTQIAKVSHGNLFYNSATMSKCFSWCSANILDLSLASSEPTLRVEKNGEIVGTWSLVELDRIPDNNYIWTDTHPLIRAKLLLARMDKDNHMLLVEPGVSAVTRALVVKLSKKVIREVSCEFVGSVQFHPQQELCEADFFHKEAEVRIGDLDGMLAIEGEAWSQVKTWSDDKKVTDINQPIHPSISGSGESRQVGQWETDFKPRKWTENITTQPILEESGKEGQLMLSAANVDAGEVKRPLGEKDNPNVKNQHAWTALHRAIWRGHDQEAQELIKSGKINKTTQDKFGQQAIHLAAERGNERVVNLLLQGQDADPDVRCQHDGQTALHRATWGGSEAVVKLLLGAKAEPNIQDSMGWTSLHWAVQYNHEGIVKHLLKGKADPNIQCKYKKTALHIAVDRGYASVTELLLEGKADFNIQCKDNKSALDIAAEGNYTSVVQLLLLWAAKEGHEAVVKLLIEKNANVESKDSRYGRTPLSWASCNGHEAIVKLLVEKNANVESKDSCYGRTPLSFAAGSGHRAVVKLLVQNGADIESKDSHCGLKPVSWASSDGHELVVKLLVEKGTDINVKNGNGRTALQAAAERGHLEVVDRLLAAKAD